MIRKFTLFILLLSGCHWLHAQEQTLFNDFDVSGAFGGPFVEFGKINGQMGTGVGGGGALIFHNAFLGGYGLGTDYANYRLNNNDYRLELKHGGFWIGVTSPDRKLLHFYADARIGWGRAQIKGDGPDRQSDRIFALTPEAGFELNVFKWFKLAFTGGYRYIGGLSQLGTLKSKDFSSPIGTLTFRFGGF
jgi:hypothetical protein